MCWSLWQPCHVNLSIGTVLYWISVPLFNIYYHSTATRWVFIIFWNFFLLGIRNSKEKLLVNCLCFWWKKRKLAKASRWMWTKCFQGYAVFRWTAYPFCVPLWQKSAYSWLRKVRTLEGYAKNPVGVDLERLPDVWWWQLDSNQRPHRCERCALPTEPCHHAFDVPTTRDYRLSHATIYVNRF